MRRAHIFYWIASLAFVTGEIALWLQAPGWLTWVVLRAVGMVAMSLAFYNSPGVARPLGKWAPVVTDGVVFAAAVFGATWAVLSWVGQAPDLRWDALSISAFWALTDIVGLVGPLGLALRAAARELPAIAAGTMTGILACTADLLWCQPGERLAPTIVASAAVICLAIGASLYQENTWASITPDRMSPLPLGRAHVAAVIVLFGILWAQPGDPLLMTSAGLLAVALSTRILALDRSNSMLWARLSARASRDPLTGLLNRAAFISAMEQQLHRHRATILFLDLDEFAFVNDTAGPAVGDTVLRTIADSLTARAPLGAVAARLGGDEFALMLDPDTVPRPAQVADDLISALAVTQFPQVGVSIGVSRDTLGTAMELLNQADLAMYTAKQRGGRQWATFEPAMRALILERKRIEQALRQALTGQDPSYALELAIDPVCSLDGLDLIGYEAQAVLLDDPNQVQTTGFFDIASAARLLTPLNTWFLDACLAWLRTMPAPVRLFIPAHAPQCLTASYADTLTAAIARHGIDPTRITLRLPEETAVQRLGPAQMVLAPLRAHGIQIVLDAFGTGASSLRHLHGMPVDALTIDASFVAGLGQRAADEALTRTIIAMADGAGLAVLAAGVHTEEQRQFLLQHGCPAGQGPLLGSPRQIPAVSTPERGSLRYS